MVAGDEALHKDMEELFLNTEARVVSEFRVCLLAADPRMPGH